MSLYQYKLKKEIVHFQESIERLNKNIKLLKRELIMNKNVYTIRAHKNMLSELTFFRNSIITKLEEVKKLIH